MFTPGFVNYKKGCTRLAAASDKVYQLLAHGRWFSPGTPASSTTKTGRHDITEILLKVVLNTIKSINHKDDCLLNGSLLYLSLKINYVIKLATNIKGCLLNDILYSLSLYISNEGKYMYLRSTHQLVS